MKVLRQRFLYYKITGSKNRIVCFYLTVLLCLFCLSFFQHAVTPSFRGTNQVFYGGTAHREPLPRSGETQILDEDLTLVREFFTWLATPSAHCRKIARLGGWACDRNFDGNKNVCLDELPTNKNCLVYSFGMDTDISFEDSFWHFRGCEEHLFDPMMVAAGWNKTNITILEGQHFYNIELSTFDRMLPYYYQKIKDTVVPVYKRTFDSILKEHGNLDRKIDYLKMDIEGAEWEILPYLINNGLLTNVQQIAIEVHALNLVNKTKSELAKGIQQQWEVLQTIEDEGFRRVSINDNRHHLCILDLERKMKEHLGNLGSRGGKDGRGNNTNSENLRNEEFEKLNRNNNNNNNDDDAINLESVNVVCVCKEVLYIKN